MRALLGMFITSGYAGGYLLVLYNVVYLTKCFLNVKHKAFIADTVFLPLVGIQM